MKTPENIRKLREKHDLNRDQFARLVYSTPRAVYSWELGERNMPEGLWELALIKLEQAAPNIPEFVEPKRMRFEL